MIDIGSFSVAVLVSVCSGVHVGDSDIRHKAVPRSA